MKATKQLIIDPERCKACSLCIDVCPRHCLELSELRNRAGYCIIQIKFSQNCIACGQCAMICPEPLCLILESNLPDAQSGK